MKLIAVDPGTRKTGFAVFEHGSLVDCGVILAGRLDAMLRTIGCSAVFSQRFNEAVIERPTIYGATSKADPNDVLQIALVAGCVIGRLACPNVHLPTPQQWKGSIPKNIMHDRALKRILTLAELNTVDKRIPATLSRLDMLDAVCLGLAHLGRNRR